MAWFVWLRNDAIRRLSGLPLPRLRLASLVLEVPIQSTASKGMGSMGEVEGHASP